MTLSERFELWKQNLADNLRGKSLGKKLSYLFYYYKGWLVGLLLLCLLAFYIGDVISQSHKEIVLQGFFTNDEYNAFDAGDIQKEYGAYLGVDKHHRVVFDDSMFIDTTGDEATELTAASNGKIIAYMATDELDFVVTSKEVLEYYMANVPLRDIAGLLPEELSDELSGYLVEGTDADGNAIFAALDMKHSRYLRGNEYVGEGEYFMFIPARAPHPEAISEFLYYCFGVN